MTTLAAPGAAAPGDLDPTFDGDGQVTTDFVGGADESRAVAIQADGKIVAVGEMTGFGAEDYGVVRYRTDGSLDPTFDGDGKLTTDFSGSPNAANAVAVQADGKIVVGGGISQFVGSDFTLARYNPDGSLDTSFDEDGRVQTDFAGSVDVVRGLAIQSDGKIVAAGFASVDLRDFALARYNTDGSLDPTFGGDGRVTVDFLGEPDQASAVLIPADGRIVTVGHSFAAGTNNDFAVARFNTDGSLDSTFHGDGKLTTDFFGDIDEARALAIQADGKLVAAGSARLSGAQGGALARYNSDGSLDSAFDADGKVTTHSPAKSEDAWGVAIQADGKIVIAGCDSCFVNSPDFAVFRYRPDGSLDPSFGGGDGKVTTEFGALDWALAVVIQPDGKIVASGFGAVPSGDRDFALARYQSQDDADLALVKTDPPGRVPTGRNMTYRLTVTNGGPGSASGVTVTDQLPPSVTFVSATPSQGSCGESGGTVTCNLGTVGNGATAVVDIVVKPTVPGTITNTASVAASTPDPNQGNNSDSENTSVCRITSRRSSIPCG
jgi:uncharacterized delta-60 repeat protein/uncharacterized repeat protein (TIGR01451 family)